MSRHLNYEHIEKLKNPSENKRRYINQLFYDPTLSKTRKMMCAPKVGHKVKCNGKSELFSKNSSSTDARVREKYQFNLS